MTTIRTDTVAKGRRRRVWVGLGVLAGIILLVVVAAWVRLLSQPERLVPVGSPVRFDDFTFSVMGSREMTAGGRQYLVVALKVDNQAKIVTYTFRREIVVLIDDDGDGHRLSPAGQREIDAARGGPDPLAAPIPAGSSATTELAFEMPARATNLRVQIAHESQPIANAIDDLILNKPRLKVK